MKPFFVAVLFACLYFLGFGQAIAVSKEDPQDENSPEPSQTEEERVSLLRKQVLILQESVAEITRSFSTLELIAKNPSIMAKIDIPDFLETGPNFGETESARRRRGIDSASTFPRPFPISGMSDGEQPISDPGPYYPIYSGQCYMCPAGAAGERGPQGPQGDPGRDGRDGRDAPTSVNDTPSSLKDQSKLTQSSGNIKVSQVGNTSLSGAVYIRWGHDECPQGAELVYSGSIGGSYYSHTGSGTNQLCMPEEPIYDEVESSARSDRALIYSTEYQVSTGPSRIQPKNCHTPACAVCRAPSGRTTKLMIPARNICPDDNWRLEYVGYLMAQRYTYQKSEFVCVDREMISKPGTSGCQNGGFLFLTELRCTVGGGLDCGPYVNGYEFTCAVCTI